MSIFSGLSMHELSLAEEMRSIIQTYAVKESVRKVIAVYLQIGTLSGVVPEALQFCFDVVVRGSIAEGALLKLQIVPGVAKCPLCQAEVNIQNRYDSCSACGGFGLQLLQGDEMRITELEVL